MNVLLVEDSRLLRERLRGLIDSIPAAALVAETDSEQGAYRCLEQNPVDVVVLDLRLQSGSGLSVLEHIKATYPAVIVLVLTNYGQPEYRAKCAQLGANYFFDKSKDIEAFEKQLTVLSQARSDAVPG